jgi:formylglycine-generating enzyme required for sulfatase activity
MRGMRRLLLLLPLAGLIGAWRLLPPAPLTAARRAAEAGATPAGFVYVPGGDFWAGSDDADADDSDRPRRRVRLESFYIGKCEVTHAEWKRFRPGHKVPAGYGAHPITNILRSEAEAYCRSVGGRLPTDQEWEKAARGTDGRRYPWGDRFEASRCNMGRVKLPPNACLVPGVRRGLKGVSAHVAGASPYGALQMAGNAWEWVADNFGGDPARGIIRGGAVGYYERDARTYHRGIEGTGVT